MSYETKILPSGIVIENRSNRDDKYRWFIKDTNILHNEGEPTVEYNNGNKFWVQHGKNDRLDGPAVEYGNGVKYWYKNGKRHRLDGPAVEYIDGDKFYYIYGISYKKEDYWNHPKIKEYMYLKEHPELESFL